MDGSQGTSNGKAPELARALGVFPATNIVLANMIGAGIFTSSGLLLEQLGDPRLMLGLWLAGGVLALCGAWCYGELGAAMPEAGGEYVFLAELFHPLVGFLTGWVSFFVGFSAPLAASSLGFAEYMERAFPALLSLGEPVWVGKALAVAVIVLLAGVHLRGIEVGTRVQNWLTVGKVALLASLVIAGFAVGRGDLGHLAQGAAVSPGGGGWMAIGLSLMWITFAYSGWNAAAYVGSEIVRPERNLPRALLLGTSIVTVLYLGLNLLFVYAVPPAELRGVISVGGAAASGLFGGAAEVLVSALIAFALVSSISALILLGPRVYYAMARDGVFFEAVARVHPVTRVPHTAILLQCLLAIVMVLTGTFDQILTYMGFCLGIFPVVAVLGVFRLRRRALVAYRMPAFPLPPLLFITVSVTILVLAYLERPVESTVAVLTVAVGVPLYAVFRGRSGASRPSGRAGGGADLADRTRRTGP